MRYAGCVCVFVLFCGVSRANVSGDCNLHRFLIVTFEIHTYAAAVYRQQQQQQNQLLLVCLSSAFPLSHIVMRKLGLCSIKLRALVESLFNYKIVASRICVRMNMPLTRSLHLRSYPSPSSS